MGGGWSLPRFLFGVGGLISRVGADIFGLQIVLSVLMEWVGFLVGVIKPTSGSDFVWLSWRLGSWASWVAWAGILVVGRVWPGWCNCGLVACLLLVGRVGKVNILVVPLWLARRVGRLLWLGSAGKRRVGGVGSQVGFVGRLLLVGRVCW